jgi:hypothetical protein
MEERAFLQFAFLAVVDRIFASAPHARRAEFAFLIERIEIQAEAWQSHGV